MKKFMIAASAATLALGAGLTLAGMAFAAENDGPHRARHERLFEADANADGAVSRAEFDAQRAAHFTQLDADNNGALTREEMRAGWRRHAGERGGPHGRGMERMDSNSDGNVTREEFLARPTAHFDRMDANDDGVLSAEERPQRRERPEGAERGERREHRFNPDANDDGQVSRDEFATAGGTMFAHLDANSDGSVTRAEAEAAGPHHHRGQH